MTNKASTHTYLSPAQQVFREIMIDSCINVLQRPPARRGGFVISDEELKAHLASLGVEVQEGTTVPA